MTINRKCDNCIFYTFFRDHGFSTPCCRLYFDLTSAIKAVSSSPCSYHTFWDEVIEYLKIDVN